MRFEKCSANSPFVLIFVFIELVPFKEKVDDNKELVLLKPAAVAPEDDMACCRDLGKEALKAKAAAAAVLRCSLVLATDSNCRRGCLKTKLPGFKETLALPLLLLLLAVFELQPKFEKTFVVDETEENVVESFEGSRLKSFEVFSTKEKKQKKN